MKAVGTLSGWIMALCLAAAPVLGATVDFTPVGPTSADPGDPIMVDLGVDFEGFGSFNIVTLLIGSNEANDLAFVFDGNWLTNMPDGAPVPIYEPATIGFYNQEAEIDGYSMVSRSDATMAVGQLTIDTTGMSPGNYTIHIDEIISEVVWNEDENFDQAPISGTFDYTITPEPGTLLLLVLGAAAGLHRRR